MSCIQFTGQQQCISQKETERTKSESEESVFGFQLGFQLGHQNGNFKIYEIFPIRIITVLPLIFSTKRSIIIIFF